ncbi:hypothetical protein HY491_04900 [Candidatus Woesearchaeota archaeon]|nr:hypothetical protein [Candidatus Woesearchaeota archaeon]
MGTIADLIRETRGERAALLQGLEALYTVPFPEEAGSLYGAYLQYVASQPTSVSWDQLVQEVYIEAMLRGADGEKARYWPLFRMLFTENHRGGKEQVIRCSPDERRSIKQYYQSLLARFRNIQTAFPRKYDGEWQAYHHPTRKLAAKIHKVGRWLGTISDE